RLREHLHLNSGPHGYGRETRGHMGRNDAIVRLACCGLLLSGWQAQGVYGGQAGQALGFGNASFTGDLKNIGIRFVY
ncbi:MAG: hypothetical protein ABSH44_05035, partial [Bryobacteraceae bacterium]